MGWQHFRQIAITSLTVAMVLATPPAKAAITPTAAKITANIGARSLIANLDADFYKKASSILRRLCQYFIVRRADARPRNPNRAKKVY